MENAKTMEMIQGIAASSSSQTNQNQDEILNEEIHAIVQPINTSQIEMNNAEQDSPCEKDGKRENNKNDIANRGISQESKIPASSSGQTNLIPWGSAEQEEPCNISNYKN